ncbi:MAG: riboflavin synthase [Alphaproteobacteria bacterium]
MFTGIITDLGRVGEIDRRGEARITIATAYDTVTIAYGASIACSGVCLTVVDKGPGWLAVEASAETLRCTTLGTWQPGTAVNLERPLRLGDEFGGHLVTGHVDGVARMVGRETDGESLRFIVAVPEDLSRFIAKKGSVALDGVSLTVNEVNGTEFAVSIIPHTWRSTTFGTLGLGDRVNLELDLLARYIARLTEET